MKPKEQAESLEVAQTLLGQWIRYRQFFFKGIGQEEITPQDEAQFLETTSAIAQNARKLGDRVDSKQFPFKKDQILQLIKTTMSVAYFRTQPDADRKKFYKEWHQALVYLSRTVGALKFLTEGYVPPVKKGAKGKAGGKKMPVGVIVAVVAVVAIVGVGAALVMLGIIG